MKKILTSVASIFLVIVLSGIVYSAIPIDYTLQWNNIGRIFSTIIFDESDGTASSQVYGKSGTSKIECTLTLYKQCGGTWVYVDSVSDSTTTNTMLDLSIDFDADFLTDSSCSLLIPSLSNISPISSTSLLYIQRLTIHKYSQLP